MIRGLTKHNDKFFSRNLTNYLELSGKQTWKRNDTYKVKYESKKTPYSQIFYTVLQRAAARKSLKSFLYHIVNWPENFKWFENFCYAFHPESTKWLTSTARKVSVFGVIVVRSLPHSDWIWRYTEYLSLFSPNVVKYGQE